MAQQLGMQFDNIWKVLLQRIGDLGVESLALAVQQARVSCFLHERMLEDVRRSWRLAAGKDQFCRTEVSKCGLQGGAANRRDSGEQPIRKFAPQRSTDLCNLLSSSEPVETGDQ